tara:strand:+ start:2548 stop:3120 length:573 start_codon:yes stop_codon:yes gene_type:complete
MEYFMKSAMRKLISLCVLAMVAISPLAIAQQAETTISTEAAIAAAVVSEGSAEAAYTKLTSPDDTTLSADQKEALVALGSEAGTAFITAVNSGFSLAQAGATVAALPGVTNEQVNTLVARLSSPTSGDGSNQQTAGVTNQSEGDQSVQTETATGPGTPTPPTGSGVTPPPAAPGTGGAGGGSGGGVVSGN